MKLIITLMAVSVLLNYILQILQHKDITDQLEVIHIQLMDMIQTIDDIAEKVDEITDIKMCGR